MVFGSFHPSSPLKKQNKKKQRQLWFAPSEKKLSGPTPEHDKKVSRSQSETTYRMGLSEQNIVNLLENKHVHGIFIWSA